MLCYLVANLNKIVSDKTGCGREKRDQCLSEFKAGSGGYYIANALKYKSYILLRMLKGAVTVEQERLLY